MNLTFLAALFTSSLALLGLTVGKDSKVSEFRQQWIDGLRADVAEYISSVQHLFGFRQMEHFKNEPIAPDLRVKAVQRTNELRSRIRLRLDLEKPLSKKLTAAMERLQSIANGSNLIETDLLRQVPILEECTSALLDEAWERVKKGELRYRICIGISAFFLAASIVLLVMSFTPLRAWFPASMR